MDQLANFDVSHDEDKRTLVESLFPDPDTVSQGEYTVIYEFLQNPDIRNDSAMIASCLDEFVGWAQYMLKEMSKQGYLEQNKDSSRAPFGIAT